MKRILFSFLLLSMSFIVFGQPGSTVWKEFKVAIKVDTTNIIDSTDFSVKGEIAWDSAFIYLNLIVTDDSIYAVGEENTWMLDNFEIYFDMNNVKIPAYPRGQSIWPSSYDGYPGCWQIRLIPGRDFDVVNPGFHGCIQNYQVTDTGYTYELKISIDSLLSGYVPEVGKEIGFDVLASDNDNDPYYRDQLSFYSPSATIWCDAAIWGTIRFADNDGFDQVYDETNPGEITNLIATQGNNQVLLEWDAATDNIVVEKYIIFVNDQEEAAIYANLTGNAYVVNGITSGVEYTFGVVAMDIAGNRSDEVTITYIYTGVNSSEMSKLSIYPNPSFSFISLNNETGVNIEVFNTSGQLVIQKSVNAGEKVDISALNSGIYTVRIIKNNNASILKLIKK